MEPHCFQIPFSGKCASLRAVLVLLSFVDFVTLHEYLVNYFHRFLFEAPFSALAGVVADARDPPKVKFVSRNRLSKFRERCQVNWIIDHLGNCSKICDDGSTNNPTLRTKVFYVVYLDYIVSSMIIPL